MAIKKIEYIEIEGIKCEVKNHERKEITQYYQNSLNEQINNYISSIERWTDIKKSYRDTLKKNMIIAPFVMGWLKRPENNDEYLVIKGFITIDELKFKKNKGSIKKVEKNKPKKINISTAKKRPASPKKPISPKKPTPPKKPISPKKPNIESIKKEINRNKSKNY